MGEIMRTRKEIQKHMEETDSIIGMDSLLEVLLDIRDILDKKGVVIKK